MLTSHVLWNEYVTIAVNRSLSNCEIILCFCPRTIPENSDNKPWVYICSEGFFCWAYFRGSLFSKGLNIGRNFAFQNGLGLTIKTAEQHYQSSLKQLKTASINSPWAYILEGLLSEGFLRLRLEGLIFGAGGGAYFGRSLLSEFYGISKTQSNRHEFVANVVASLQSGDLKSRLKSLLRSH